MFLRFRRNIPPEHRAKEIVYSTLLAIFLLWSLAAAYVVASGVYLVVISRLQPDSTGERRNWGVSCGCYGIVLGLPGVLGALSMNRKLRALEDPTRAPPGFDVLSPDSRLPDPPRYRR